MDLYVSEMVIFHIRIITKLNLNDIINTEFTLEDGRKSKISATMEIRHLIKTPNTKSKKPTSTAKKSSKGKK